MKRDRSARCIELDAADVGPVEHIRVEREAQIGLTRRARIGGEAQRDGLVPAAATASRENRERRRGTGDHGLPYRAGRDRSRGTSDRHGDRAMMLTLSSPTGPV